MNNTARQPRRRELFVDPGARVVWAGVRQLDVALQFALLEELQEQLGAVARLDTHERQVRHAIAVLREAAQLLEHSPTVGEYRQLRSESPERMSAWPPDGTIRRWLGGNWNEALGRAHLESVRDGDALVYANGPAFTADEITAALRECARELGDVPTISRFFAWARRPDVVARAGRRPQSLQPIQRLFGGFVEALRAAGLADGGEPGALSRSTIVRMGNYRITEEQMLDAIRLVAKRIGRSPRVQEYLRERELIIQESAAAGEPRAIPSHAKIQRHFSIWDDALVAADLKPLGGRHTQSNPRKPSGPRAHEHTNEGVLAVLAEAHDAIGDPFTIAAFTEWRTEQAERDKQAGRTRRLPSVDTVYARFGTWPAAVEAMQNAKEAQQ
jgi:hypothetical protein